MAFIHLQSTLLTASIYYHFESNFVWSLDDHVPLQLGTLIAGVAAPAVASIAAAQHNARTESAAFCKSPLLL